MKLHKLNNFLFPFLDKMFLQADKGQIRRTQNIRHIPEFRYRRGGKVSYAEWAHVIGIFQTLIYQYVDHDRVNNILDVGCGTGLLAISAQPLVTAGNFYTGIDVIEDDIRFCKQNFQDKNYRFDHFDVFNPTYAKDNKKVQQKWPYNESSFQMITALSVWTHFNQEDAIFYFKEIDRVLDKGGRAIITFFYQDDDYIKRNLNRSEAVSKFHNSRESMWQFDINAYSAKNWYTTKWANDPEDAIAITEEGLGEMLKGTNLKVIKYYPGSWKEQPGLYFQDIIIFEKS